MSHPIGTMVKILETGKFGVIVQNLSKLHVKLATGTIAVLNPESLRAAVTGDCIGVDLADLLKIKQEAEDAEMDRLMQMDVIEVGPDGGLREARDDADDIAAAKDVMDQAAKEGIFQPGDTVPRSTLEGTTSHPDYEHWTCGTDHIRAQRVLRIIEAAAPHGVTVELVQALDTLVYDAGIASCREALAEPMCAVPF